MIDERSKPYSKIDLQELYLASPNTILEAIREHGSDSCQCLMVIGHNPGMEVLASMLAGRAIEMPTSAIAVFRLPSIRSWSIDFSEGLIELEHFIVPRALQPSLDSE
jgi:phosphohistidine phosphatase